MIDKLTTSRGGIWRPTTAVKEKQMAGGCELVLAKLVSGGGACTVELYDATGSAGASENNLKWVLDSSTTFADSAPFSHPLLFSKGIYAKCVQGWDFNPVVCLAVI